jgi:hypothetical protein
MTPAEFGKPMAEETEIWARAMRAANIKADEPKNWSRFRAVRRRK